MYTYITNIFTSLVVATQFQATFARHVFPCLDEPDYKARFTLHIARPSNSTAISNTPLLMTAPLWVVANMNSLLTNASSCLWLMGDESNCDILVMD